MFPTSSYEAWVSVRKVALVSQGAEIETVPIQQPFTSSNNFALQTFTNKSVLIPEHGVPLISKVFGYDLGPPFQVTSLRIYAFKSKAF